MSSKLTIDQKDAIKILPLGTNIRVTYIIEKDGSLSDIKVIKGSNYSWFNDIIVDCVGELPNWKPGKDNGYLVRMRYIQCIRAN